ncbi:MAG: hypothetical protein LBT00_03150 [Spirochaetaceae bacterium]|nr:hypothetical protein [Spirochaetaceae bacterium]
MRTRRVKQSSRGDLSTGLLRRRQMPPPRNDGRGRVPFSGRPASLRSEQGEAIQTRRPLH